MKKSKWLPIFMTIALFPLLISNSAQNCNDVSRVLGQGVYHYNLYYTPGCNFAWRSAAPVAYPDENYSFCWVSRDGSFYRTSAAATNPVPAAGTPPNTDIPISTLATQPLLFTGVANRKGDDGDTKKIVGGFNAYNGGLNPKYVYFPTTQNILTGSARCKIQNDYGSDLIAKTDEILLIMTIDHPEGTDSLPAPDGYILRLTHSNSAIIYTHTEGNAEDDYPNNDEEYFEFASHHSSSPTGLLNNPTLSVWNIANAAPFAGHEKNVYCLLNIYSMPSATDENRIIDTFSLILNDLAGNRISTSKYIGRIGASHDPNMIEVDKPVSDICGREEEELEYIIHFQNIGSGSASNVTVNLELDPALDPATLKVWEAGIGTQSILGSAMATTPLSQATTQFPNSPISSFDFRKNVTRTTSAPAVGDDVTFNFNSIDLKGIEAADIEESKGFIRFTVKTRQFYTSIHNRAGIIFDRNPEIVTNLAVTTCMQSSDSISAQLAACHDELKNCKTNKKTGGSMDWLPWVIAGLELLVIIYLLTRKREK